MEIKSQCSVVSLKKWLDITNINFGSLFRGFSKGLKLKDNRLTDQTVALLIKKYLTLAGINSKNKSVEGIKQQEDFAKAVTAFKTKVETIQIKNTISYAGQGSNLSAVTMFFKLLF